SLRTNADLDAQHGKPGYAARSSSGEWRAIVRADRKRQSVLLERPLKNVPDDGEVSPDGALAADQVPAVRIGDGERRAPLPIAGHEVTLEVDAPDVVGCSASLKRSHVRGRCWAPPAAPSQAPTPQQLADGARCRECQVGPLGGEVHKKLFRSPARPPAPRLGDQVHELPLNSVWMKQRRPRVLSQTRCSELFVSREPFVARLPSDPERITQLRHRELAALAGLYEQQLLIHRARLFPGHAPIVNVSPMSP